MTVAPGQAPDPAGTSPVAQDDPGDPGAARDRSVRRNVVLIAAFAVLLLVVGVLIGNSRGGDDGERADVMAESVIDPGLALPDLTLTDTAGAPFPLRERTADRLTLLYLGYVNCPDVCPITTAVIDRALETAAPDVRDAVQVVLVSVDPQRDTPERIRSYLDGFDRSFVGLSATPEQLEELQVALEAPFATTEPPDDQGEYLVGHASAVYAFDPDGVARHRFPFGTRQSDWDSLLPELVAGMADGSAAS